MIWIERSAPDRRAPDEGVAVREALARLGPRGALGLGLALAFAVLPACLVTNDVDPPVLPNAPPVIFDGTIFDGRPMSSERITNVVLAELEADPAADPPGMRDFTFTIEVQDLNVSQDLVFAVEIDTPSGARVVNNGIIPADDESISRTATIRVSPDNLRPPMFSSNCRRLTVLVTSSFVGATSDPEQPGDLARAVYWLRVEDEDTVEIDLTECPGR